MLMEQVQLNEGAIERQTRKMTNKHTKNNQVLCQLLKTVAETNPRHH